MGTGDLAGGQTDSPQARFAFDTRFEGEDANQGTVTITHVGGDAIPRDELILEGDRYAYVRDSNVTSPDTMWVGTATASAPGGRAVGEGDRIVVGVRPDYEVKLVWQPGGMESRETLTSHTGPAL